MSLGTPLNFSNEKTECCAIFDFWFLLVGCCNFARATCGGASTSFFYFSLLKCLSSALAEAANAPRMYI